MRSLRLIAEEVEAHWKNVYFGAVPYIAAMMTLDSIDDMYYDDSGRDIVIYFLSNATYWRGPDAKRIKAELRSMLEEK
jgi:hypothetical protein